MKYLQFVQLNVHRCLCGYSGGTHFVNLIRGVLSTRVFLRKNPPVQGSVLIKLCLCKGLFFTKTSYARVWFSPNHPTQGSVFWYLGGKSMKLSFTFFQNHKKVTFQRDIFQKLSNARVLFFPCLRPTEGYDFQEVVGTHLPRYEVSFSPGGLLCHT